ncbi:MAG: BlaI/MecI/CopY family transcriptional regulator [Rhodanobacteraceae bacterium]
MREFEASGPELDVLKLLWRYQRLSAREIHDHLGPPRKWAYSTTRTVLERMVKKDLLRKRTLHGLNVYAPEAAKVPALASLVRDFTRRVLDIRPSAAIPMFAESDLLDEKELAELRQLLETEGKSE